MGIVINEGDCFDEPFFVDAFEQIQGLIDNTKAGRANVFCVPVNENITNKGIAVGCFEVVAAGTIPTQEVNSNRDCCFVFTWRGVSGFMQGSTSHAQSGSEFFEGEYSVKCGGRTIHSDSIVGSGVEIIEIPKECKASDNIEICVQGKMTQINDNGGEYVNLAYNYSFNINGCILCVDNVPFFETPPAVPKPLAGCSYASDGLAAMSAIVWMLNCLIDAFRVSGYQVRCETFTISSDQSVAVDLDLEYDTKFLGFLCTSIEYEGIGNVSVTHGLGCPQRYSTNTDASEGDTDGVGFAEINSIMCGSCLKGEDLYAGAVTKAECSTTVNQNVAVTADTTTATHDLCVYLFEKIDNTENLPKIPAVTECVDMLVGEPITIACAALDTIVGTRSVPQKSFNKKSFYAEPGQVVTLAAGNPNGDPDDSRKIQLLGGYRIAIKLSHWNFANLFLNTDILICTQISCGGAILKEFKSIYNLVDRDQDDDDYTINNGAVSYPACGCVSCDVTQPVTVSFTATTVGGGDVSATTDMTMTGRICLFAIN